MRVRDDHEGIVASRVVMGRAHVDVEPPPLLLNDMAQGSGGGVNANFIRLMADFGEC